jgi:hypothetical protein
MKSLTERALRITSIRSLTIERQKNDLDAIHDRMNDLPCYSVDKIDAYAVWDGNWLGPGLGIEGIDALRNGWICLPDKSMNCTIPTYTQDDLLRVQEETSIFVFGIPLTGFTFISTRKAVSGNFCGRQMLGYISIATNTGWVFNTRFLLYLIHNCAVLHTNKRYCAQCAHSDAARESRYIIQRSIQESWIVVKFVTLFF